MDNKNKSLRILHKKFNFKDIFNPKFLKKLHYENNVTKFYNELIKTSKKYGFGDNITIETEYDGTIPEKIFIINLNHKSITDEDFYYHEKILNHMADFAKNNNMCDFARDSQIILEY